MWWLGSKDRHIPILPKRKPAFLNTSRCPSDKNPSFLHLYPAPQFLPSCGMNVLGLSQMSGLAVMHQSPGSPHSNAAQMQTQIKDLPAGGVCWVPHVWLFHHLTRD